MAEDLQKRNWRKKSVSIFLALAVALNVFAIIPFAGSYETGSRTSHFMVSTANDLMKSHEADHQHHMEKCGVASCAIGMPEQLAATPTTYGKKTLFDIRTVQVTTRHLTPPDRPPKI